MVASLPMYDFPEVAGAHAELYSHLVRCAAEEEVELPGALERPSDLKSHWKRPDLSLTQVCGLTVAIERFGLAPIATPVVETSFVQGPYYRSLVVVREDSPWQDLEASRGARLAMNSWLSHSGCCSLIPEIAPLANGSPFFSEIVVTGAHEKSLEAVREDRADVAAIDCVTFTLLQRHRRTAVDGVRILTQTAATWMPPYVSPFGSEVRLRLARAFERTFANPRLTSLKLHLSLGGVRRTTADDYASLLEFPRAGRRRSFLQLCHPRVLNAA